MILQNQGLKILGKVNRSERKSPAKLPVIPPSISIACCESLHVNGDTVGTHTSVCDIADILSYLLHFKMEKYSMLSLAIFPL